MKKGLIIFDLDGTLTESAPGILKCVRHAIEKAGFDMPSDDVLKSFIGPPLLSQFKAVFGVDDDEAEKLVKYFRERYNTVGVFENNLYPGITELLKQLAADGYFLSVATSKPMKMAEVVLKHFDIEKYFSFWQGAVDDKGRSDKLDILERVIAGFGFEDMRERTVLVGDRKYDAMGAELSKIGFYGALWGYAPKGELEKYPSRGLAASPEKLYAMIQADGSFEE